VVTRRGLIAGLVLALVATACTGKESGPTRTGSPRASLTPESAAAGAIAVRPARGLHWQQQVGVSISRFPAGAKVWLSQCANRSDANPLGCGEQLALQPFLVADTHGAVTGTVRLHALAATGPLRQLSVPCRYTCVLVATVGGISQPVVAVAPLRFAAPPSAVGVARLRVSPAVGLRDGEHIIVDVARFLPGEKVWFSECAPGQRPTPATAGCGDRAATEPFTVTDDAGTRHGTRFRVSATVHGQPCQPACTVAAIGDHELATAKIRFR
jgi:hypothetical protein